MDICYGLIMYCQWPRNDLWMNIHILIPLKKREWARKTSYQECEVGVSGKWFKRVN